MYNRYIPALPQPPALRPRAGRTGDFVGGRVVVQLKIP